MKKIKFKFKESFEVWGRIEDISPLLKGLKGIRITDSGMDSCDIEQPVVEISFDPRFVSDLDIFRKISNPETGIGGLANSVRSSNERE